MEDPQDGKAPVEVRPNEPPPIGDWRWLSTRLPRRSPRGYYQPRTLWDASMKLTAVQCLYQSLPGWNLVPPLAVWPREPEAQGVAQGDVLPAKQACLGEILLEHDLASAPDEW